MIEPTEEPIPDRPVPPEEPKVSPLRRKSLEDPEGESWHRTSRARWRAAERQRPEEPFSAYDPVPLPDFNAGRPAFVSRDLLGRFLQDRDTGIVHDCHAATEECGIDSVRNGTFFHFWSEVLTDLQEDLPCPLCIP